MVLEKVKNILSHQFDIDIDSIDEETSFRDDLDADSLDLVELIMELEDEFDLEIEDEEVDKIETIEDAVTYIEDRLN